METQTCIQKRRTIRSFTDQEISDEQLHAILDAGRYAPSAGNLQNWRFIVVKTGAKKKKLADACVQQVWLTEAPVLIVVVSDLAQAEEYYGDRGKDVYCRHNAAAAAQTMLLCATDLGLGSAWVGAFDEEMIARELELPETARPEVVLAIGHPAEEVPIPPRYEMIAVAHWGRWGRKEDKPAGAALQKKVKAGKKSGAKGLDKLKNLFS